MQDEVSMLSAELLEVILYHIKQIREEYNKKAALSGKPQVRPRGRNFPLILESGMRLCDTESEGYNRKVV
jgi:hypothetical protein